MNERVDFFYTSDIQNKNKKEQKNKHQPWAFTAPDAHVHTVQTSRIHVYITYTAYKQQITQKNITYTSRIHVYITYT